jgi:hypothetical protein
MKMDPNPQIKPLFQTIHSDFSTVLRVSLLKATNNNNPTIQLKTPLLICQEQKVSNLKTYLSNSTNPKINLRKKTIKSKCKKK